MKRPPRKQPPQPPNRVWLDAIMSKSRAVAPVEPSPTTVAQELEAHADAAPTANAASRSTPTPRDHINDGGEPTIPTPPWLSRGAGPHAVDYSSMSKPPAKSATATAPANPIPAPRAATPPATVASANAAAAMQLSIEPSALTTAICKALKEMVSEQSCCFIARGPCHLCGAAKNDFVPVVNFCPAHDPSHSLCREHLRSMHRVRLEDIFAGKNQPTVSKRSLKCTVCALSCPCSRCQFDRDAEIARYTRWLEEQDRQLAVDRATLPPRPTPTAGPGPSSEPPSDLGGRRRPTPPPVVDESYAMDRRRRPDPTRDLMMDARRPSPPGSYAGSYVADAKTTRSPARRTPPLEEKAVDAFVAEPMATPSSTRSQDSVYSADGKHPTSRSNSRVPKRAAKEARSTPTPTYAASPSPHQQPPNAIPTPRGLGTMVSPSAASVLNCPDSEKSLVRLLSSLNQEVTPAVRYFAEAKEPRLRQLVSADASGDVMMPSSSPSQANGSDVAGGSGSVEPSAAPKAKRKRTARDMEAQECETGSTRGTDQVSVSSTDSEPVGKPQSDSDRTSSYRKKAPAPLNVGKRGDKSGLPTPSPRGRPSARSKGIAYAEPKSSTRKRDGAGLPPPAPPSSTRKRKSGSTDAVPDSATGSRKSPRGPRAGRRKGARHRYDDEEMDSAEEEDNEEEEKDDEDEDSELDTNLDYCEVCLAAGDLVCCDKCPRSFHLKCLKLTENDLPEGDWQCAECQKPSYFESFAVAVASKTTVPAKCLQIIECLKSHPFAKPFLLPVENVPHYTSIVKQPMDLSTITKKLKDGRYMVNGKGTLQGANGVSKILHLGSFAEDVRLIWANCKLFNDDGSGITRAADELSRGFEKLYRDVLAFVERSSIARTQEDTPRPPNGPMDHGPRSLPDPKASVNGAAAGTGQSGPKPPSGTAACTGAPLDRTTDATANRDVGTPKDAASTAPVQGPSGCTQSSNGTSINPPETTSDRTTAKPPTKEGPRSLSPSPTTSHAESTTSAVSSPAEATTQANDAGGKNRAGGEDKKAPTEASTGGGIVKNVV